MVDLKNTVNVLVPLQDYSGPQGCGAGAGGVPTAVRGLVFGGTSCCQVGIGLSVRLFCRGMHA